MPIYRLSTGVPIAVVQIWGQHAGGYANISGAEYGLQTFPDATDAALGSFQWDLYTGIDVVSGIDLVIQDALQATTVDNLGLTQVHQLTIQDALQSQVADNLVLSQVHNLTIQEALHSQAADNLTLNSSLSLVIQDTLQGTIVDSLTLTQVHQLTIQEARSLTLADVLSLAQTHNLLIQEALQASLADNMILGLGSTNLSIQDALQATKSDRISFASGGFMSITDVQLAKLTVLTGSTGSIQDLMFKYYSGLSGLTPVAAFSVTDHQRKYWETQTGLTGKSMADLEDAFYDLQLIPEGPLADRELIYWSSL